MIDDDDPRIQRLRAYQQQLLGADATADKGSLERAADLVELYDERKWKSELPEIKRRPGRGRQVDPDSFDRFAKWATEKTGIEPRQQRRLRAASDLAVNLNLRASGPGNQPAGEGSLRPLVSFRKSKGDEAARDVWERACKLASGTPDVASVKLAISKWRDDNRDGSSSRDAPTPPPAKLRAWEEQGERWAREQPELFLRELAKLDALRDRLFGQETAA